MAISSTGAILGVGLRERLQRSKSVGKPMQGDGAWGQTYSSFCLIDRVGIGIFGGNCAARKKLADERSLSGSQYKYMGMAWLSSVGW
jgi:hypothetical protein